MKAIEGKRCFDEANALFTSGRYEDALTTLRTLDARYPNTKNILLPMAMCLERLGRGDEALPLCATVVERFQDPRAMKMQLRLCPSRMDTPLDCLDFRDDYALPDLGPIQTVPVPEQEEERTTSWKTASMVGGGLIALLALMFLPAILQQLGVVDAPEETSAPASSISIFRLGILLIGLVVFQGLGFATLLLSVAALAY